MQVRWSCAALVSSCLCMPTVAYAQTIPTECQGRAESRAYRGGVAAGGSLVRQAWNGLKSDCDRVEEFEDIVTNALGRYSPAADISLSSLCRFTGVVDGILDQLDTTFLACTDSCFLEGSFAGEISAIAYCELSIALGGLTTADAFIRGPVKVCGLSFEIGCDTSFSTTCGSYVNATGECAPFTVDTFYAVFSEAQNNQCAYNPVEESTED